MDEVSDQSIEIIDQTLLTKNREWSRVDFSLKLLMDSGMSKTLSMYFGTIKRE